MFAWIKEYLKRKGFRRIYEYKRQKDAIYFGDKLLFTLDNYKGVVLRTQFDQIVNQLYTLQNILPEIHQKSFQDYKDSMMGRDVVLMAAGPTFNQYTREKWKDAYHIGVNKAVKFQGKLDYYFMSDYYAVEKYGLLNEIVNNDAKKFFALGILEDELSVVQYYPPLSFLSQNHANPYFYMHYTSHQIIQPDITKHPLSSCRSVILHTLHFALFCRPKRIYLVGCDCSSDGHFDTKKHSVYPKDGVEKLILDWKKMALFAKYYYPDVEIISINPVGLKGLFKDEYL